MLWPLGCWGHPRSNRLWVEYKKLCYFKDHRIASNQLIKYSKHRYFNNLAYKFSLLNFWNPFLSFFGFLRSGKKLNLIKRNFSFWLQKLSLSKFYSGMVLDFWPLNLSLPWRSSDQHRDLELVYLLHNIHCHPTLHFM